METKQSNSYTEFQYDKENNRFYIGSCCHGDYCDELREITEPEDLRSIIMGLYELADWLCVIRSKMINPNHVPGYNPRDELG